MSLQLLQLYSSFCPYCLSRGKRDRDSYRSTQLFSGNAEASINMIRDLGVSSQCCFDVGVSGCCLSMRLVTSSCTSVLDILLLSNSSCYITE